MNLAQLLLRRARTQPRQLAIAVGAREVCTYGELAARCCGLAAALRQHYRLRRGDRVVLFMTNCPEYLELLFAVWVAGLVAVPVNSRLHARELAFILEDTQASLLAITADHGAAVTEATGTSSLLVLVAGSQDYNALCATEGVEPVSCAPDELAWLFYTSGTTGRPKGAMLTHGNLLAMALSYHADIDALDARDSILHAAPMSHGSGLYSLPFLMQGATQVIPSSGGFDIASLREALTAHSSVSFFAAPTMVTRLLGELQPSELEQLRTLVYGGAPMYLQHSRQAVEYFGSRLVQIYGQGESPMTITALSRQAHTDLTHPRYLQRLASVGVARTAVEVRVADPADLPVPAGELGEIQVRGTTVMSGYWNNAAASAQTLVGGWLRTGDLGTLDGDGFLTLTDRSKDVIISGGSNIYPREVEEVLLRHPQVAEAAVIGLPDPQWGEQVVAFVVHRSGGEAAHDELDRLCLENIARFKRPRRYFDVDALPKNNYGKVLKTELRARCAAGEAGGAAQRLNRSQI